MIPPIQGAILGPLILVVFALFFWGLCLWERNRVAGRRTVTGDQVGGDIVGRHDMSSMTINGRTFTGDHIQIRGDRIIVDGQDVTDQTGVDAKNILEIRVQGDVGSVVSDRAISVTGNVGGDVQARGGVNCRDVAGSVSAGGGVNCDDVQGDVEAGGGVNCDDVGGSVRAGGRVIKG